MRLEFAFVLVALAAVPAAAEVYRWFDERGVTHYGNKPPAGRSATRVDSEPQGSVRARDAQPRRAQPQREQPAAVEPVRAEARADAVRGMDFETYIRLKRGMTEGELLVRAGRPDHVTLENVAQDIVKSFYYFPTPADPYLTVVTLRAGRIDHIERTRKF